MKDAQPPELPYKLLRFHQEQDQQAFVTAVEVEQLQRRLIALEGQLRRARDVGGIGIFSVDLTTQTVSATPEFFRAFGVPPREDIPAETFERLVHPTDAGFTATATSRAAGTVAPDAEYRIIRPDTREIRWIARKGEVERDETGSRSASSASFATSPRR